MFSSLRASVWSKNKAGPGLPGPSPGSVTELSERLEQAPVTLNKIRDCSQSRLYVLLVCAECTCTIKTPALPCTIFFYGIIFIISDHSFLGQVVAYLSQRLYPITPFSPKSSATKSHDAHEIFRILLVFSQFLRNLTFISSDSHEKFSLVLLQMTNYIFSPWKMQKKNAMCFKLFWYKVFVHWILRLLNFLVGSARPQMLPRFAPSDFFCLGTQTLFSVATEVWRVTCWISVET